MEIFEKGDIVSVHFPFTDGTSAKRRPALVLTNSIQNPDGDLILMQITSKYSSNGFSIPLNDIDSQPPLPLKSYLKLYKIFTLDKQLVIKKLSKITMNKYSEVIDSLIELIKQ